MTRKDGAVLLVLVLVTTGAVGCKHRKGASLDNEALHAHAENLIERRRFFDAIQTLGDLGLTAPVPENLEAEKNLTLADAYFLQGGSINAIEAQSRYEQFLNFYPLHPRAPYARYMVGLCLLAQADDPENDQEFARRALLHFESMARDLPADEPWGRAARAMLLQAQDRLAEHEWTVAQYYLERNRWPGAIGRLETVIERYPGFRQREEALYQLALAQRAVGDIPRAQKALGRLLEEFPAGQRAAAARRMLEDFSPGPPVDEGGAESAAHSTGDPPPWRAAGGVGAR